MDLSVSDINQRRSSCSLPCPAFGKRWFVELSGCAGRCRASVVYKCSRLSMFFDRASMKAPLRYHDDISLGKNLWYKQASVFHSGNNLLRRDSMLQSNMLKLSTCKQWEDMDASENSYSTIWRIRSTSRRVQQTGSELLTLEIPILDIRPDLCIVCNYLSSWSSSRVHLPDVPQNQTQEDIHRLLFDDQGTRRRFSCWVAMDVGACRCMLYSSFVVNILIYQNRSNLLL